ncbi:glucosidase II beta subunit-like-domain-containing protein [Multifurca ochricompacta]|uniref:Glucosidase 2 subunit beta n=1 Tax=Multifurca ochricompacta TaxID=376703 RepID=A0AAD4M7A8_9AGAM|nr:glucosidase II beta subunit-like-domain-containing protein [Multifurca ochricompacta]
MPPLLLLLTILPTLIFATRIPQIQGVHPSLLSKYKPEGTAWNCLDGTKSISWAAVNDDYCDCPDGSDEPGTSACPNNTFYCTNAGHIGATIPSSRVNDGLCEPSCCDGSDEPAGVCENTCGIIGEIYRKEQDTLRKLRRTGSKIRSTYIAFAQKEKKRLEAEVKISQKEIATLEKEVARCQDLVDRTEAISAEVLEHKKTSPLFASLITHHNALKSLQREHKKHLEREKQLSDILDTLRRGYNPNYQDMAVLEAVRGWEYLADLPHVGEAEREEGSDEEEEATIPANDAKQELEEGEWTKLQLENELDGLLNVDHVSLLMEHDTFVDSTASTSSLHDIKAYLPDFSVPQFKFLRDTLASWLNVIGIARFRGSSGAAIATTEVTKARQKLDDSKRSLDHAQKQLEKVQEDLNDLFELAGYGAQGEWKKLHNTCLTKDAGDYVYEVCLFEEAKQIPNHGGSTFSLGRFTSWNPSPDVAEGSAEYYSKQIYSHGTKCWNGPERSVQLYLTCGTENALLTVTELEKCEYLFTGTSPALCLPPLEEDKESGRDEL